MAQTTYPHKNRTKSDTVPFSYRCVVVYDPLNSTKQKQLPDIFFVQERNINGC